MRVLFVLLSFCLLVWLCLFYSLVVVSEWASNPDQFILEWPSILWAAMYDTVQGIGLTPEACYRFTPFLLLYSLVSPLYFYDWKCRD